ncbi:MAG: hypothetical protein ACOYMA_01710 [Bacteroidia bacterium]
MNKFTYLLICFILSVNFWNIAFITKFLDLNAINILTWIVAFYAFYHFANPKRLNAINSLKYTKYFYLIMLGVIISMFSAYFFWGQNFIVTMKNQKGIYSFILLVSLLFVQPSQKDMIKALKIISIVTVIVWFFVAFNQNLMRTDENSIDIEDKSNMRFGTYVNGIHYIVLYLYYLISIYIKRFSWKIFIEALLFLVFVFLYSNRSMLFGALIVFGYSLFKFKSKYKGIQLFISTIITIIGLYFSKDMWISMINRSTQELNDVDYNRWKAFYYFIYEHSPNWFCNIFGNGMASRESSYGIKIFALESNGIFISDIGMFGMWSDFGIIPLASIYSVLIIIILKRKFPLYLKFMSLHIIFFPTIFHFWTNPGVFLFVIIIYLYSYHNEYSLIDIRMQNMLKLAKIKKKINAT